MYTVWSPQSLLRSYIPIQSAGKVYQHYRRIQMLQTTFSGPGLNTAPSSPSGLLRLRRSPEGSPWIYPCPNQSILYHATKMIWLTLNQFRATIIQFSNCNAQIHLPEGSKEKRCWNPACIVFTVHMFIRNILICTNLVSSLLRMFQGFCLVLLTTVPKSLVICSCLSIWYSFQVPLPAPTAGTLDSRPFHRQKEHTLGWVQVRFL